MKLFRKLFPPADQRMLFRAAKEAFDGVCDGDTSAARIYRDNPYVRARDWKAIQSDLLELTDAPEASQLTQRLRGRFTESVETLVMDNFYSNLDADDRASFAAFIESSREASNETYYYFAIAIAYDHAYAAVLEFIIFAGWNGTEESKANLKTLQQVFIDACKSYCEMGLTAAKANSQGRVLTDHEKAGAKTTITLKEAARRILAGERASTAAAVAAVPCPGA
jgi:hypothetical protein